MSESAFNLVSWQLIKYNILYQLYLILSSGLTGIKRSYKHTPSLYMLISILSGHGIPQRHDRYVWYWEWALWGAGYGSSVVKSEGHDIEEALWIQNKRRAKDMDVQANI